MTGASGRARDALGQATGQSPDELIAKLKELIANNRLATGAALGGLGALILGTGAGRSLAGIGGTHGWSRADRRARLQGLPELPAGPAAARRRAAGAAGRAAAGGRTERLGLRARCGHARAGDALHPRHDRGGAADGRIDAKEQQKILGGLQTGGARAAKRSSSWKARSTIRRRWRIWPPASPAEQDAVQVYTAARIAIDLDNGAEHAFLQQLAEALEIDATLAAQVDAAARGAA